MVGIGEDGIAGLGAQAQGLIAGAELVFGGVRHLALAAPLIRGEARAWPSPFDVAGVLAARGRAVCVLASGDPFLFGVGATLARAVDPAQMRVVPGASAFGLAASRLGWALQDVETVSLHGRAVETIRPLLHPGTRILALTSDGAAPASIARLLAGDGFGPSRLCVLEALGGPQERLFECEAAAFGDRSCAPLNVLAVDVVAEPGARMVPLAPGLEDALYETDGQLTKREVRALTLSALAPRRGERLVDVGAGSGSVAIEWMLRHPSLSAVAVEARSDRAARIGRNAAALGVPGLRVVMGEAPAALAGLSADAVFVGGGGTDDGVLEAAVALLRPGGRLVANAVTLEMQARLTATAARMGGDLVTIAVSRAAPVGGMTGWRPAMPVVQWRWVKP